MQTPLETPSRGPLQALNLILSSLDAIRNLRALYVLLTTFALAGMLVAMAQTALGHGGGWAAVHAGMAMFVAFYGGNAAGILVMDQARGVVVRDVVDALRSSLLTAHRLLLTMLMMAVAYALLGAGLCLLIWLCRSSVSGPSLGPWMFGLAFPVGVVLVGIALLAWVAVVVPLTAPGVWAGERPVALVRQLWRWMRERLVTIALLIAAVSVLMAGIGALVSFVVVAGGSVVAELAVRVAKLDVSTADLMASLVGRAARATNASRYTSAARAGGGAVFALALVLPGLVYLRATCVIYLAMANRLPQRLGDE